LIIINAIGKSVFSSISSCKDTTYIHREKSRFDESSLINEENRSTLSINKYDKHTVTFAVKENHFVDQVLNILSSINGLEIVSKTLNGEYITVKGNIELFEDIFQSSFHKFTHEDKSAIRMKEYSLPKCLSDIVGGVLNVVDLPFDFEKKSSSISSNEEYQRNLVQGVLAPTPRPTRSPTYRPGFPTPRPTLRPTSSPTYGASYAYITMYANKTCSEAIFQQGYLTNYCFPDGDKYSYEIACTSDGIEVINYESIDCTGTTVIDQIPTLACYQNSTVQCHQGTNIEEIILMNSGNLIL